MTGKSKVVAFSSFSSSWLGLVLAENLGSERGLAPKNTPTWQMISQCFTLRMHISATDHNMQGRQFWPTSHF